MIRSLDLARWLKDLTDELNCTGIIGIKEFSHMQVRFLMLNTICLSSLHNIQQYLIDFIPVSLIFDTDDFFLVSETTFTELRHTLFPCEHALCIHESNGNTQTYDNQAYMVRTDFLK